MGLWIVFNQVNTDPALDAINLHTKIKFIDDMVNPYTTQRYDLAFFIIQIAIVMVFLSSECSFLKKRWLLTNLINNRIATFLW